MTREEMLSLKEGDVVYCSGKVYSHCYVIGEKLIRVEHEFDDRISVWFKGSKFSQFVHYSDLSFTNPLTDNND